MAKTPQRAKAEQSKQATPPRPGGKGGTKVEKKSSAQKKSGAQKKSDKVARSHQVSARNKGRAPITFVSLYRRIDGWLDHAGGRFGIGIGIGLLVGLSVVFGFNRFSQWINQPPERHLQARSELMTPAISDDSKPPQLSQQAVTQHATSAVSSSSGQASSERTMEQLITDTQSEITEPDAVPPNTSASVAPRATPVVPAQPTDTRAQIAALPVAPSPAIAPTLHSGQPAWLRNAVAFHAPITGPMIAIVLDDVGVNKSDAELAVDLPGPITLSMMTYADNVADLAARAHARGHELMLHVPMQPVNSKIDPGPNALLVGLDNEELKRRLEWGLHRFPGFIGINNHMGSRFTQDATGMRVVMQELRSYGLLFLDSRTIGNSIGERVAAEFGVPHVGRDVFLDDQAALLTGDSVGQELAEAERIATKRGYVIAIGHPHPTTVDVLKKWMVDAKQRGFVLVPLSVVARREIGVAG